MKAKVGDAEKQMKVAVREAEERETELAQRLGFTEAALTQAQEALRDRFQLLP